MCTCWEARFTLFAHTLKSWAAWPSYEFQLISLTNFSDGFLAGRSRLFAGDISFGSEKFSGKDCTCSKSALWELNFMDLKGLSFEKGCLTFQAP